MAPDGWAIKTGTQSATVTAHTVAPPTGAPAGALTTTARERSGATVGEGAAAGGPGWHAASARTTASRTK